MTNFGPPGGQLPPHDPTRAYPAGPPPYGPPQQAPPYGGPTQQFGPGAPTQQFGPGGPTQQYGPGQPYPPTAAYGAPGGPFSPGGPPPPPGYTPPRKRRRWPIITAIVAILALGGGAIFFVTRFGGGGASTANAAVTTLASSLADGNLADAVKVLHPAERDLALQLNDVVTSELKRLEIIKPDAAPFGSGSFTMKDLKFDEAAAEQVRDDVVINKLVSGTITLDQDPNTLPFTDSFRNAIFPNGVPQTTNGQQTINIADVVKQSGQPIRIASVRVDGKWYVSIFYTAADYALQDARKPWPKTSIPAKGAASAQDALKETVQAVIDQDARRLIELAPPQELQVLHDVGDVLVAEAGSPQPGQATITDLQTTPVTVRGEQALQIDKVVITVNGETGTLARDGDCITFTAPDDNGRVCSLTDLFGSSSFDSDTGGMTSNPAVQRILPKLSKVLLNPKIVTVNDANGYYVSPFKTVTNLYADVLGTLQPQDVRDLVQGLR